MDKLIYIFILLGLLVGNRQVEESVAIEEVYVLGSSDQLSQFQGILNFDGILFNGYVVEFFDKPQTQIKTITPHYQGKKNGLMFRYYENGQLAEERLYKRGNKVGTHQGWWPDGSVKFELRFNEKGNYEGASNEWYANGQIFKSFNYLNGQEKGHQRMWNMDGSLRANYIIKNNRKYGLQGRKKCISTESVDVFSNLGQ